MTPQTTLIALAQLLATSLWFSANVAGGTAQYLGAMTMAVQGGFITGTLLFSFGGLADRFRPSRVFALSAILGALFNLAFAYSTDSMAVQLVLRVLVGVSLAGVYPIGMKMAVAWAPDKAGQTLGLLVGMLTLGTALPMGVRALGSHAAWQTPMLVSSVLALAAAAMIFKLGDPATMAKGAPAHAGSFFLAFKLPKFRATAFAYFGHMWELYAFWTIVPLLVASAILGTPFDDPQIGWAISFAVIGVGCIGCIWGGGVTRRLGSERVAGASLAISGAMCLLYPLLHSAPLAVRILALLIWGGAVIADSPQFSALAARHCPPALIGSSLALQTSIGFAVTIVSILIATKAHAALGDKVAWILLPGPVLGLIALRKMWFTPFEEILPPLAPTQAARDEAKKDRADWYRRRAEETFERAARTPDAETRAGLIRVAEDWKRLAEAAQNE
ncbi:MAG: MFS transporter [Rhodospirillaceae bacterium]